jgi:uracil-DNA glycosylase
MNLFANDTKELLEKYMTEDWAEGLSNHLTSDVFLQLREKIGHLRKQTIVYPDSANVFRALKYPLLEVKVVIVGQDPYHNDNADGLAFSCKQSLSPSLQKILQAVWKDHAKEIGHPIATQQNMNYYMGNMANWNLDYLAEQGVLLYNPALTVEKSFPGSHKDLWIPFSKAVFETLNEQRRHILWMEWGGEAQKAVRNSIKVINPKHNHLIASHPANAAYNRESWNCNHFYDGNKWLEEKGLTKINWLK